jgi:hypothetical protein
VNLSSLSKLECIALQAEEHLHHSLLVCIDHVWEGPLGELVVDLMVLTVGLYVFKGGVETDLVIHGFSLLDDHDFFDCIDYVEFHDVLTELA